MSFFLYGQTMSRSANIYLRSFQLFFSNISFTKRVNNKIHFAKIEEFRFLINEQLCFFRQFQCSHCNEKFYKKSKLDTHEKNVHKATKAFKEEYRQVLLYSVTPVQLINTYYIQSNLCTATTLGTQNLWPLLTGGRCSEVTLCYKT